MQNWLLNVTLHETNMIIYCTSFEYRKKYKAYFDKVIRKKGGFTSISSANSTINYLQ